MSIAGGSVNRDVRALKCVRGRGRAEERRNAIGVAIFGREPQSRLDSGVRCDFVVVIVVAIGLRNQSAQLSEIPLARRDNKGRRRFFCARGRFFNCSAVFLGHFSAS